MEASFDKAAPNYDTAFTDTNIGKMQRSLVYGQLSKQLNGIRTVLEINCGTGEDAVWLANKKIKITATDISSKMIEMAQSKGSFENIKFQVADIKSVASVFNGQQFDLIFSNFGGLNCLSGPELEHFFQQAKNLLPEKGKMVLVIMPKNTLWEQAYFLAKAQFSSVYRRKKNVAIANVDGEKVPTYYFNPKDIVNLAGNDFKLISQKPIGFFVPPSYMEPFFRGKIKLLKFLGLIEKGISGWTALSKYADHYIITLQKR